MKIGFGILIVACGGICACGPIRYNVTGASGKLYTAPDVCQALIQCKNSGEPSCYVPTSRTIDQDGKSIDETYCKEIKK